MPFSSSAHIYDVLYQQIRDYEAQARQIRDWVRMRRPTARSLLDVACGTDLHLSYLRTWFDVAGVDVSATMARVAGIRTPAASIYVGDMRDFQLNHRFDAVICLFSSITYARTLEGLNATLATFARHLAPGGVAIVEPFIPPEAWQDDVLGLRTADGNDRKIAMVDRAVRTGRDVRREIAYVVATPEGLEQIYEEHRFHLFTRAEYENAFRQAGFLTEFDETGFVEGRGMYLGVLAEDRPPHST